MITLKELDNVSKFPRFAPFPGDDYAKETFKKMKEQLTLYEEYFKGKEYSIIFSDGEEIDFQILEKNMCHMLGIDYTYFFEGTYYNDFVTHVLGVNYKPTSYEWAKLLLDASDAVINYDKNCSGNKAINYFKCKIKCSIFEKLFELEEFNFGKLQTGDDTKLLYTQSNEPISPYFCIRLKQENEGSTNRPNYIINSLLAPQVKDLGAHFDFEAAIPTQIMVDNNSVVSRKEASAKQKMALLYQYQSIILNYGHKDNLNVSGDYISYLQEASKDRIK